MSDDANVVNTFASSGDFSIYLNDATGQGGPQDVLLVFDTTQNITNTTAGNLSSPYTTGTFSFSQMMYVVPGKTGYFNFQAENIPGISWALEVNLDANGGILMSNTSGTNFTCTYPLQTWFEIAFHVDLSNNIWEVFIDSVSQGVFSNSINQIASLDLYFSLLITIIFFLFRSDLPMKVDILPDEKVGMPQIRALYALINFPSLP